MSSDRVQKKITNYAKIIEEKMPKNVFITSMLENTRWILQKFQQFIKEIIKPF